MKEKNEAQKNSFLQDKKSFKPGNLTSLLGGSGLGLGLYLGAMANRKVALLVGLFYLGIGSTAGLGLDYAAYKFKGRFKHTKDLPEDKLLIEEITALKTTNNPKLDKSTIFFGGMGTSIGLFEFFLNRCLPIPAPKGEAIFIAFMFAASGITVGKGVNLLFFRPNVDIPMRQLKNENITPSHNSELRS